MVQRMMRHSTLELMGRYTRPHVVDIEDAAHACKHCTPTAPRAKRPAQPRAESCVAPGELAGNERGGICRILTG